jgi:hypothetical protein
MDGSAVQEPSEQRRERFSLLLLHEVAGRGEGHRLSAREQPFPTRPVPRAEDRILHPHSSSNWYDSRTQPKVVAGLAEMFAGRIVRWLVRPCHRRL